MTVTASMGHPRLGCSSLEEVPEGVAPRVVFKLKPECIRKHKGNANVIDQRRFRQSVAFVPPTPHAGSARAGLKPGATSLVEQLGLSQGQDPVCRQIASAAGDLLSWLRPENVALCGPRLSESEDIESWIEGIVTRWEKQHGPIPNKELLLHEIG